MLEQRLSQSLMHQMENVAEMVAARIVAQGTATTATLIPFGPANRVPTLTAQLLPSPLP